MNVRNQTAQKKATVLNCAPVIREMLDLYPRLRPEKVGNAIRWLVREMSLRPGDEHWEPFLVLVGSVFLGPDEQKIAKTVRLPLKLVERFGKPLREYRVWQGTAVPLEYWLDPQKSFIHLTLDAEVALGRLARWTNHETGVPTYCKPEALHAKN